MKQQTLDRDGEGEGRRRQELKGDSQEDKSETEEHKKEDHQRICPYIKQMDMSAFSKSFGRRQNIHLPSTITLCCEQQLNVAVEGLHCFMVIKIKKIKARSF